MISSDAWSHQPSRWDNWQTPPFISTCSLTTKRTNKLRLPEQCCQPTSNIVMVDSCRIFLKDSCLGVSIAYPSHYIKSRAFLLHLHQTTSTSLGSQASLFHDSSDLPFRELMDLDTKKKETWQIDNRNAQ